LGGARGGFRKIQDKRHKIKDTKNKLPSLEGLGVGLERYKIKEVPF
jgi:hypothetical protein